MMDFVNTLDTDTSLAILSCLVDPSNLVRASAVSRSWREFVIKHSLSKNLCLKLFHQVKINSLKEKKIGLYFSAAWCGLCQRFTPQFGGFIIGGRRVLTNAHSVEHHTQVKLKKRGSDTKFLAIGTECDIGINLFSSFCICFL